MTKNTLGDVLRRSSEASKARFTSAILARRAKELRDTADAMDRQAALLCDLADKIEAPARRET